MTTSDAISLFEAPLAATPAWREAVAAANGLCTCTGACGRKHANSYGRCAHSLSGGYRLFLTEVGALLCAACFDKVTTAQRKAIRDAAEAAPEPENLFDPLAEATGV